MSLPASSRAQIGEGSASTSVRSASMSSACFWKRSSSSASSRLTPLTSLHRTMARPPTTLPSASIGRPESVVSVGRSRRRARAAHRRRIPSPAPARARARCRRRARGGAPPAPVTSAGVADDLGLVVGRRPGDQDLGLRAQQRVDAIDVSPRRDDLVARRGLGRGEPSPRAHQRDRGHHREHRMPSVSASAAISWPSSWAKALR